MCAPILPFKWHPREGPQDENWSQVVFSFIHSFISEDWGCGEHKRGREGGRKEGAEIGGRLRRGNGASRVDKSGWWGNKAKKGKWKWGD